MTSRKLWIALAAVLLIAAVVAWAPWRSKPQPVAPPPAAPATQPAAAQVPLVQAAPQAAPAAPTLQVPAEPKLERTPLPRPGTNAQHRSWVKAEFGPAKNQLGWIPHGGEQSKGPQGFTITKDGKLLVLDTFKNRLIYYDKEGRMEKTVSLEGMGLEMPADVDVTKDGTTAVVDRMGAAMTKGLVLLDAEGRVKADLAAVRMDGRQTGMYTVGNDVFFDNDYLGSQKVAESNGTISNEAPNVYTQGSRIPGRVAPDGITVVDAGITDNRKAEFSVTVTRGNKPEHLFTRFYSVPPILSGLPYAAADAQGRIYVVLGFEHPDFTSNTYIACLNEKGDPVGQVEMPRGDGDSEILRHYRVVESGGIVINKMNMSSTSYEFLNCQP